MTTAIATEGDVNGPVHVLDAWTDVLHDGALCNPFDFDSGFRTGFSEGLHRGLHRGLHAGFTLGLSPDASVSEPGGGAR